MIRTDSKNRVNFWAKAFLALGALLGAARLSAGSASAASETVLYSFCQQANCADGDGPEAGLIATTQGALYGTTEAGGTAGVAFVVSITGFHGILHAFQGDPTDGGNPIAPLFRDKSGNLFGTTGFGGASGFGTVFKRSASGVYKQLHAFTGTDGSGPDAGVIADSAGNLYGTTAAGGASESGTIFRLSPGGILTTLYSFCSMTGCTDGSEPEAGLIGDANGNLYGTTRLGGANGFGVVFKIHADRTGYTVLHTFTGGTDGANPLAGLSADLSGNLYGTTNSGGAHVNGTVFKFAADGTYSVLYNFCSLPACADGSAPNGGVILDAAGNLYGTTLNGGTNNKGAVYSLTPSLTETVLYSFCSLAACADGSKPMGNLVALSPGNLYGTTMLGGTMNAGTVYQLTNTGFVP